MQRGPAGGGRIVRCRGVTRRAKVRYRTRNDAKIARRALQGRAGGYWRVYQCPACKGWHLTTRRAAPGPASPAHEHQQRGEAA